MSQDNSPQSSPKWVTRERYSEMTGISVGTIRGWQGRHLTRGVHYLVEGRVTLINHEEIDTWLTERGQRPSVQSMTQVLESVSSTKPKPIKKQSQGTTIPKLTSKRQSPKETE